MGLTKEECVEYLETLRNFACIHTTCCMHTCEEIQEDKKLFNECIKTFKQLIKEHFDNSPLKFEQLEGGMWVWDSKYLSYRYMSSMSGNILHFREYQYGYYDIGKVCLSVVPLVFEDNRFYRREVSNE